MPVEIVYIILGVILLMLGKKLLWFFSGSVFFVFGYEYAGFLLPSQPERNIIIIALVLAIIGLIVAFLLQKIGMAAAGFFAGGHIALNIAGALGVLSGWFPWVIFLIGGLIGAVFMYCLFDWAIVFLSALTGAFLIVYPLHFGPEQAKLLFMILFFVGVFAQGGKANAE